MIYCATVKVIFVPLSVSRVLSCFCDFFACFFGFWVLNSSKGEWIGVENYQMLLLSRFRSFYNGKHTATKKWNHSRWSYLRIIGCVVFINNEYNESQSFFSHQWKTYYKHTYNLYFCGIRLYIYRKQLKSYRRLNDFRDYYSFFPCFRLYTEYFTKIERKKN